MRSTFKIKEVVTEILKKDRNIKFAYIFGSFVKEGKYGDIDIGIYISSTAGNIFEVTSDLKEKISRKLKEDGFNMKADDIDIAILNLVSLRFLGRVFEKGLLIVDGDPEFRTDLLEKKSIEIRECLGVFSEARIL